ncbi:MAG TPA: hypothetical protein VFZ66_29620 [Herpetosiphonaceae bacterium]
MGYWSLILPSEKRNLTLNPSFERGTIGAGAIQSATLGSASDYQAAGAYSLFVVPNSNGTSGAYVGTFAAQNGTAYSYSAYVRGSVGVEYMLAVANTSNALAGSVVFQGGGTWHRYVGSYTENSSQNRRIIVRKANGAGAASTGTIYIDAVQAEVGSVTTPIDGDQPGCRWDGNPHQSTSFRPGTVRSGGSIVALNDLGAIVLESPGIGMADVQNIAQQYGLQDGALYQNTFAQPRAFTIASLMSGTSYPGLHAIRAAIIDAIKPDLTPTKQPTRFWYSGAGGTLQIDAYYDGGLSLESRAGFSETAGMRFVAFDPYWQTTVEYGTALLAQGTLSNPNYIIRRDTSGQWGTLGGGTINNSVYALAWLNGTLVVGGAFNSAGGTVAQRLALWHPLTERWGTLTGGTVNGNVATLETTASGTLYVGGNFQTAGGTRALSVAAWNGAFGTLGPGTLSPDPSDVVALHYAPSGTLYVGGAFTQAAGTRAFGIAMWTSSGWGTLTGGTFNQADVRALTSLPSGTLIAGGAFTAAAGTTARGIAAWNGGWGTLAQGMSNADVRALTVGPNGILYAGGFFGSAGIVAAPNIAAWNGVAWSSLQTGVGTGGAAVGTRGVLALDVDASGLLFAAGSFTNAGPLSILDRIAQYNTSIWLPLDVDLPTSNVIRAVLAAPTGELYVGGDFTGADGNAASVAVINNPGSATAYPVVTVRNTTAFQIRVYELANTTTGDAIYFNLVLVPGETLTIDLRPGSRGITSSVRGNVISSVLPGSRYATWRLQPGINNVAFFAEPGPEVTLVYRPRAWSADDRVAS